MWKILRNTRSVKATLANAVQFRDMKTLHKDRLLKKPLLDYLRNQIRVGAARPFDVSICWCDEDGELYRVNGKHSSTACAEELADESSISKPDLYFSVTEYRADTLRDVANLYNTYDRSQSGKSSLNTYTAIASTDKDLSALPDSIIKLATTGIDFSDHSGAASVLSPEERAERMLEEKLFTLHLNTILSQGNGKAAPLSRTPVAAAIYRTIKKSPAEAIEFWGLVKSEESENRNCPTRELARYLATTSIVRTDVKSSKKTNSGRVEMMAKCLLAWRDWRKGKTKTSLRWDANKPIPECV